MPIDQAVRVDVGGFINSVVIANPGVADVRVVDSHTFYLMGNGYGTTSVVIALDRDGRNVYSSEVVVTAGSAGRGLGLPRRPRAPDMACASSCQPAMRFGQGRRVGRRRWRWRRRRSSARRRPRRRPGLRPWTAAAAARPDRGGLTVA